MYFISSDAHSDIKFFDSGTKVCIYASFHVVPLIVCTPDSLVSFSFGVSVFSPFVRFQVSKAKKLELSRDLLNLSFPFCTAPINLWSLEI